MLMMDNLKSRVMKLSEDVLYGMLDQLYDDGKEDSEEYRIVDAELDKRAQQMNDAKERKKELERQEQEHREELKKKFEEISEKNGKRCTMKAMVLEFGEEYRDDYYIDPDNTVRSLCNSSSFKLEQIDRWECEDVHEAAKKVDQLIYYRVYNDYFRDGPTEEILTRLMTKIVEIKSEESSS